MTSGEPKKHAAIEFAARLVGRDDRDVPKSEEDRNAFGDRL